MTDLLEHLRHLMLVQHTGEVPETLPVTEETRERLREQANQLPEPAVVRLIDLLAVVIEDAGLTVPLAFRGGRVEPAPGRTPNVTLRGRLAAFRVLALRREDPDALFFDRRLAIEGETETGLLVKNFLDAFEFDVEAHLKDVLPPPLARPVIAAMAGAARAREVYSRMAPPARSMPAAPPR